MNENKLSGILSGTHPRSRALSLYGHQFLMPEGWQDHYYFQGLRHSSLHTSQSHCEDLNSIVFD